MRNFYLSTDQLLDKSQSKQECSTRTAASNDIFVNDNTVFRVVVNLGEKNEN